VDRGIVDSPAWTADNSNSGCCDCRDRRSRQQQLIRTASREAADDENDDRCRRLLRAIGDSDISSGMFKLLLKRVGWQKST